MSIQAYNEAVRIRDKNPERYRGRGLIGVFDDVLLHRFTSPGRGKNRPKKGIDSK